MDPATQLHPSEEEERNWLELPSDVLSLIFIKLGAVEILAGAQWVCSTWRNFSKEPHLFRSINLQKLYRPLNDYDKEELAREAVDRSCGDLIDFSIYGLATDHLLQYVAEKSRSLRCLRLLFCENFDGHELIEMAKKVPQLEELEICLFVVSLHVIEALGSLLPQLKSFRYNHTNYYHTGDAVNWDEEAVAIAENMHELRHLNLVGNRMKDNGVRAILDGCPHLLSLDLRKCIQVELQGDLKSRLMDRNLQLRLPDDSMDDFEFYHYPGFHVYPDDEDDNHFVSDDTDDEDDTSVGHDIYYEPTYYDND